jgi:hypothetical protein
VIDYESAQQGAESSSGQQASGTSGPTPFTSGGKCTTIKDGTACIESVATGSGYDVEASYTYGDTGTIAGHVEMTKGGCPGSLIENGPNQTFTEGVYQLVVYGPVSGSAEWASTFWYFSGSGYSDWGTACATL